MPIRKPGKHPFAPWLQTFKPLAGGGKKITSSADLMLTPLIDMFVLLVVFLIMNFSATGELLTASKDIELPKATNVKMLERAPIIQISAATIAIEGVKVGDSEDILRDEDLRVPQLTDKLQEIRKIDEATHPGQAFKGQVIINADQNVEFKLVRKVMMASAEAGYGNFNYAVKQALSAEAAAEAAAGGT